MRQMKDSGISWIGQMPSSWDCERGKFIFRYVQKPIRDDDGVVTCFRDGEVTLRSNRREEGFTMADKEIGYQGIDVGDLVVHGMDGFAGAIGISDSRGKASPVLNVLDTNQCKRYFMYYLRSMAYSNVFVATATGIRVRSCDLRWNKLAEFRYPLPTVDEQQRIADFLDDKCAEIDALTADIQKQIETMQEYRRSLITETVTKGLDPDAEMKDSGIEWIGQIPTRWRVCRLKYFGRMESGTNLTATDIDPFIGEYPVYGGNGLRGYYRQFTNTGRHVLIGRQGALAGNVHLVDGPFWATDHAVVFYGNGMVNDVYLYYMLTAMNLNQYAFDTAAQPGLAVSKICNLSMCVPPTLNEQHHIAAFLDHRCAEINSIIETKQQQIDTLSEYKKSLIYEYVTGKKEVV